MVPTHAVIWSHLSNFIYHLCSLKDVYATLPSLSSSCHRYVWLKSTMSVLFQVWIWNILHYNKCQIDFEWDFEVQFGSSKSNWILHFTWQEGKKCKVCILQISLSHYYQKITETLLYLANEMQAHLTEGYSTLEGVEKVYFLTSYRTVWRPVVLSGPWLN